jgi:hypothetical protein
LTDQHYLLLPFAFDLVGHAADRDNMVTLPIVTTWSRCRS